MSTLLEQILKEMLIIESVSLQDVDSAIDNHERIIINYHSKGENNNTGARIIEVYAYGLTKAGNPVIRAFQPYGDTTTKVPSWKFFRLDRITSWKPTEQYFERPADFYYKNLGDFNPDGDETMSVVYKIADFGKNVDKTDDGPISNSEPEIFKTDTERNMDKLRKQLDNPVNISDIMAKNGGFKKASEINKEKDSTNGLVIKQPKPKDDVYKTDTEKGMDKLRQQLNNPKYIQDINPNYNKELSRFRDKLGDTSKPITYKELNQRISNDKEENNDTLSGPVINKEKSKPKDDVYKTDTEKGMDKLRQQLNNPKKIDLSRIPKR